MKKAILDYLREAKTIAVVGASANPARPSYTIAYYLMEQGYEVIPVNPNYSTLYDRPCYPDIKDIPGKLDIVDIFRRSEFVEPIVDSALARGDVGLIWMQDGVYHRQAARKAEKAGILVVMNNCIYRVHSRYLAY